MILTGPDGLPAQDIRDGDPTVVFAELFDSYGRGLHRYLARRVGPVADDLLSETFVAAIDGRARFNPALGAPRAWLYGIATNLLRQHIRQERLVLKTAARAAIDTPGSVEGPADYAASRVDASRRAAALAEQITALSPGDRDVLLLTAWAGLDSNEVAAALQIPVGTVRSRLHRIRRNLRQHDGATDVPPAGQPNSVREMNR